MILMFNFIRDIILLDILLKLYIIFILYIIFKFHTIYFNNLIIYSIPYY
jgi:hypothetical protein